MSPPKPGPSSSASATAPIMPFEFNSNSKPAFLNPTIRLSPALKKNPRSSPETETPVSNFSSAILAAVSSNPSTVRTASVAVTLTKDPCTRFTTTESPLTVMVSLTVLPVVLIESPNVPVSPTPVSGSIEALAWAFPASPSVARIKIPLPWETVTRSPASAKPTSVNATATTVS